MEQYFLFFGLILLSFFTSICYAQCPAVSPPCSCDTTPYEPVSIMCRRGSSLQQILQAISGASNTKIDRLAIIDTQVPTLPPLAFQTLSLSSLAIQRAGLSTVNQGAFDGPSLDLLTDLNLEGNNLGQVPQTGITKLKNLKKLLLRENSISTLPPNAFGQYASQGSLEKIVLAGNKLSGIGTVSLSGLTSLNEISFEKNMFGQIPTQGLSVVRDTLENLNLGLNKITNVPVNALQFPNLNSLSLEFNGIPSISPEAFRGVPNLKFLYLGGNKFRRFDPNMFRFIQRLEILGMGEMPIQVLPNDAFRNTPFLRRLEMTEAAISEIQPGTFQRIRDTIATIVLNRNQLTRIRQDMYQGLINLQSLDVQGNLLQTVDDGAWANLPALQHLDISNNQLQLLEPRTFLNTFQPNVDSRVLYLCNNPWVCDDRLEWLRQWLRDNPNIMIDKGPGCLAECAAPSYLAHVRLRDPNPVTLPTFQEALPATRTVISSIGWIILAIILAILLTSICLLALVRWFVGRRRRQDKEKDEEERILRSSVVSGYKHTGSIAGSAYPASGVDLDLPPATSLDLPEQRSYYSY